MTMNKMTHSSLQRQRGVASLLISLILLVVITFVTLYTSRSVLMEQKISTNEYRGRMAFEAAEAGIEASVSAIGGGWAMAADDTVIPADDDSYPDCLPTASYNVIFDTDGVLDADGNLNPDANTLTLANGSSVTVTMTCDVNEDLIRYDITSVGVSDDVTSRRTIEQTLVIIPPLPNVPDNPLLTRGGVVIGGSATVSNPEGHSTIWSGGDVNVGSNNATSTAIADPTDANYPDCLGGSVQCGTVPSSTKEVTGLDIIESDTSLANLSSDEFFYNFFGEEPAAYKDSRVTVETNDMASQDGVGGEIIWVNGDVNIAGNNTFGSLDKPVIIIVDGDFSGTGNNNFFGLLFIRGSITGSGGVDVVGSAVVNGVNSDGGGSLDVVYNSRVLKSTYAFGRPAAGSGSWRDF